MKTRYKFFVTVLMLSLAFPLVATAQTDPDSCFAQAEKAYNGGKYDVALENYNAILEQGLVSAPLYYNMGNTYYKMKEYPKAILNYERALKLNPSNDDIKTNLEIARLAVVDKIDPIPQSFIIRWWNGLKNCFSADGWATASLLLLGFLLACLFIFLRAKRMALRKTGFFVGLLAAILLVFSVIFAFQKTDEMKHPDQAIVMSPTVTVKSSPNATSTDLFVLHEGSKVQLLDEADGWNKVKIANGSVGWLPTESMEVI